jgi:hypothetical protein
MGLRERLRRLEHRADARAVEISQRHGLPARFPPEAVAEAFVAMCDGRDHPLLDAARSSSDPSWSEGTYSTDPALFRNVPDLSG